MSYRSFSSWPFYTKEESDSISQIILSNKVNYWTGSECREFEKEFAKWADTHHAIALMNGSVALDLAFRALGIGPGDEVIVTPRSFIASVSCVVNAGAKPVFADVDIDSGNLTAESIRSVLSPATRAVVCVHLAGWVCDMDPIMELAAEHDLFVIEDCAQAHGARYNDQSVGSIGHIGAWSFCQDKIMTTGGEGGMVTCNDDALWQKMWSYKDHGKSYEAVYEREHPPGFRWLHDSFGTNWRMTEMQAAIGRIQLKRMEDWTTARTENALSICEALEPFSGEKGIVRVPKPSHNHIHAYYKYYAYVRPEYLAPNWSRDRIVDEINKRGVPCFQGSCSEIYLEKAFDETDFRPVQRLPVAKQLGETSLMFLVHPTLTQPEISKTMMVIREVFDQASR